MTELRNTEREIARFRLRLVAAALFVLTAFGLLAARLAYLQVSKHDELSTQAENNRIAVVPITPNRGLILDRNGVVLANNYSAYTLLSFFAVTIHRRLLWFTVPSQAVQILPLFLAAQAVSLVVHLIAGGMFPGWELILAPVFQALLWPVATWLLLAPQRRAPDPDENRPL